MPTFVAQRIRFQNGERHSVLQASSGLPVHEVTLYLGRFRRKGRAANTVHFVCSALALLYRQLAEAEVDLLDRLTHGRFLTHQELDSLASSVQYRVRDLQADADNRGKTNVINIHRVQRRRNGKEEERRPVDLQTQASRLRYIAGYLAFLSDYVGAGLPQEDRRNLEQETRQALESFRAHKPKATKRAKLGARMGLSAEEQARVVAAVDPSSPITPWKRDFVRRRNWLIVVLFLASGMRCGELLGLQIGDIHPNKPKLRILRRADAKEDLRMTQPNTKTSDREIELRPSVMRKLQDYLSERREIKAARRIPQVFVSYKGDAMSTKSIDKMFRQLRQVCPGLPVTLTSHVMRHSWNERFSEEADAMGLSDTAEQRARNTQQGWADNSKTSVTYTRRHTAKKGQEIALKLQERLEGSRD